MSYTGQTPDTEPAPDWRKFSACRGLSDDTFFPKPGNTAATNYAKSICAVCPVRLVCLEVALREEGARTKDNRFGVRGGKTHGQRYALYTTRRKRRAAA